MQLIIFLYAICMQLFNKVIKNNDKVIKNNKILIENKSVKKPDITKLIKDNKK